MTIDMDAEAAFLPAHRGSNDEVETGGNGGLLGSSTGSPGLQWEIHRVGHGDPLLVMMVVDVLAERLQLTPAISGVRF